MPGISVVTPTFNRAGLLERVWSSLRKQTYPNFEWIVIDDGSTDNTEEAVKAFADSRIKYFFKKNGGVNSARNAGEKNATGDYVLFLDSDDELFDEQTLEFMEGELKAAGPQVACVALPVQVTGQSNVISKVSKPKMLSYYADIVCNRGTQGEFVFLFRRDAVALRAWPDLPGVESLKIWAIAKDRPFLFINRPGTRVYHTSTGDNLTGPKNTVRAAPYIARGLEKLIAEHRAAWIEHRPEMYGQYLYNLALNQALAKRDYDSAKSLVDSWHNRGPKLKIATLGASLLLGPVLRQKLFLATAQMRWKQ